MSKYKISLNSSDITAYSYSKKGDLGNFYSPLQNLNKDSGMGNFTTDKLDYDYQTPVEIELVDEYDGSENIIINNDKKFPTLINSRFSVQENNTYLIPEHAGNSVTNIYNEDSLNIESSLLKLYDKIPTLTFNGITEGGSFKCGSYVFYFKYADSDNNLSNVVQESGVVQLHVGQPNTTKVRMGLEDERADKNVHFTLTNVDKGFDYVRVFYERTSSGQSQASATSYFMIDQNFPILNQVCDIFLTGNEVTVQITKSDLQTEFADIQSAKTSAICSNILFLGNTTAYEQKYQELQQIAWMIYPRAITKENQIGELTETYDFDNTSGCYYDVKNVYNYTGYWPDEYYRFGVVFIYNNNQCSNVYNIQGADLSQGDFISSDFLNSEGDAYEQEPENYIFKEKGMFNSKGVVRLPRKKVLNYTDYGTFNPQILGVQFNTKLIVDAWNKIHRNKYHKTSVQEILKFYDIKGLFFVRQKRIPSIYAQGIVVGLTGKDHGCVPVLRNSDSNSYITKSFLSKDRLLLNEGSDVIITSKVENKALFVPDSELQEATFNQIFTGQEFALSLVGNTENIQEGDHYYTNAYTEKASVESKLSKVTAVQRDVKLLTDGETYFSTLAGSPHEPSKTSDVNNVWDKTPPQNLTTSTSLIRGKWGYFVGISNGDFEYGDIVNIKNKGFAKNETEQNLLEFQKRFKDSSSYSAISERVNVDDLKEITICYRGDCFPSLFTHKVMNNFIDPELPTNQKIIDPACWCNNYAVRCTAILTASTHSNLTEDNAGWYVPTTDEQNKKEEAVNIAMAILTFGLSRVTGSIKDLSVGTQTKFANEIAQAFETKQLAIDRTATPQKFNSLEQSPSKYSIEISNKSMPIEDLEKAGCIRKVDPAEQENNSGLNLKAIFKPSTGWNLHGTASINRADVNAVSFAQWFTFPICSSLNLAFRDMDFQQPTEEAAMNKKRSFYPLEDMNIKNHLIESNAINHGAKKSIASIQKVAYQQIPFLKQEFFNRIYWSRPNASQTFVNSYRMIFSSQFQEYPKEYGSITKIIPLGNYLFVCFQHGMGLLTVNTTPQNDNESSPYLAFRSVLPTNVQEISSMFGSMWKDSVIKSEKTDWVYGVDTVAKKIWQYLPGQGLNILSDNHVNQFLNDYMKMSEFDFQEYLGHVNVKTHYNAFKDDIMFTFYKDIPTEFELTEAQKNAVLTDFNENVLYYSGPAADGNSLIEGMIVQACALTFNLSSDELELNYTITEGLPVKVSFQYRIVEKRDPKGKPIYRWYPAIYRPIFDKNNELFNAVIDPIIVVTWDSKKNQFVSADPRTNKVTYYNELIFTTIDGDPIPFDADILVAENPDKNTSYYYYPTSQFKKNSVKYSIRKGYVYSLASNKPITPLRPIKWEKGVTWSLCYNEATKAFQTFYDWTPLQSANIDNIYFSFDKDIMDNTLDGKKVIVVPKVNITQEGFGGTGETETISYKINKAIVDRTFSNEVTEYYKSYINKRNLPPILVWKQTLNEGKVLCFYTNLDAYVKIPDDGCRHIIIQYQKPDEPIKQLQEHTSITEYIEDHNINQKYLFHLIYKTDSSIDQKNIYGRNGNNSLSLTITDPHIVDIPDGGVKKGDFNYYYYRDTNYNTMALWKHGQAGIYDNQGKIKPTHWYGNQHEFNFEFIVNTVPEAQKIFNNLQIISNKTAPKKFEYEVVGEGYDWYIYKPVIGWIGNHYDNIDVGYKEVLSTSYKNLRDKYEDFPEIFNFDDDKIITKLPYLKLQFTDSDGLFYNGAKDTTYWADSAGNLPKIGENNFTLNSSETCLTEDAHLSEFKLHTESLAHDMKKYGRVRGNMEYLEDEWKVEIRPVNFRYAYIENGELKFTPLQETRHRDKFLRVKVRYDGKDLALIQMIATLFDISYA